VLADKIEVDALLLSLAFENVRDVLHDGLQLKRLLVENENARFDLGQVEDVLREVRHHRTGDVSGL